MSSYCSPFSALKMHLARKEFIGRLPLSIFYTQKNFITSFKPVSIALPLPSSAPPSTVLSTARTAAIGNTMKSQMGRGLQTGRVAFSADGVVANNSTSKLENREVLVHHILVPEDKLNLLLELQQRIVREGVDLSDLATEYSICPSKEEGGMLGWVQKGQMVQEFEEAAFSAPLNKLVRCKTKFGWHLLQVLSEREGGFLQAIEPEELQVKMQDADFITEAQLMDVRESDEVSIASLPGFKIYPLGQFGSWGPTITTDLNPSKDTFVLCHHGVRSLQVARWLLSQGFRRVYNISGGIHQYSQKIDSSIPTY
uniref:Peptidylprolyl isomerase n=1 Tax=Picea sitchensis TaxID=3332 RepID=D5AAI3_PICSI|nr:unknown [Picea sitchensis]